MNTDLNKEKPGFGKLVFRWVKVAVLLYSIVGIALYYLQEKLLFHPEVLPASYQYKFDEPFKELQVPVNATDTISLVDFFPKDSVRKGVVVYFHGNMKNINHYAKFADNFTAHGYEVLMADYPGFGKSTGERTEALMYEEAKQVYALAASKYKADSIVIYGKSLGTGIATFIAANRTCKQLILETPYYSIPAIFGSYVPFYPLDKMITYKIPTYVYLQDVKAPVTILHGSSDRIIPYRCAAKLKPMLKAGDKFITIDGGSHNNLNDYPVFHATLDSLLAQ